MSNKANWTVGRMGPRQKTKARARLAQVCAGCGNEENLTLDHKVARAHGGTNSTGNLQMLCERCNFAKSLIEQQGLAGQTTTFANHNETAVEMNATLYLPHQTPQLVSVEGLCMPDPATGFARVPDRVPGLLGCALGLVDVLASGPEYVVYSVFDSEEEANPAAMAAVAAVSGVAFDAEDEDAVLRGAVLVVFHQPSQY